ncbi:uncharacterized protein AMSG_08073 [Thecamonas trahens ATCC 50062]|uniref:THH1/TOM1/TOM3 domain-containing protein n=1 Tax=Thecamonas trahens ATCC 50062 TaxID=461836 RepID=A0A0L0DJC7_THETB|nr:hypothetical protein AMSG_08073 [Thecamonas trahens ATCC 50062]KNC52509.1 hypothetical protein AMSG_08073 [Thecamonas trahens ATCC 50062]|eukprot:XP_013755303.1 hypothetical protein AMSG_08073 [Thecamonas trahens ATCC 50062]
MHNHRQLRWHWAVVSAVLVVVYSVVGVFGGLCFAKQMKQRGHLWQRLFYLFLMLGCGGRVVYFGILEYITVADARIPTSLLFVANTVSPFLFFSAFLILLFLLVEIYHGELRHARLFVTLNVMMYATYGACVITNCIIARNDGYNEDRRSTKLENAVIVSSASMYLITAACFAVYGARLRVVIRKLALNKIRTQLLFKITSIATVVTVFFVIRSGFVLYAMIHQHVNLDWWFVGLYYIILEATPMVCMLYILRRHSLSNPGYESSSGKLIVNQREKHPAHAPGPSVSQPLPARPPASSAAARLSTGSVEK